MALVIVMVEGVADDDAGAVRDIFGGNPLADASGRSGDNGYFVLQTELLVHDGLPVVSRSCSGAPGCRAPAGLRRSSGRRSTRRPTGSANRTTGGSAQCGCRRWRAWYTC